MKQFKQFRTRTVLDDVCEIHGCHLWSVKIPIKGKVEEINQCPECEKENIRLFEKQLNMESEVKSKLSDTYEVFARDSIVSSKLASKSLHDYEIQVDIDEKAMNFVKRLEREYAKGKTGNAIITGPSGVGKSHLTYGLARFINEQFKSYDEPKSVLFISVVALFDKIRESFEYDNGYSEAKMVKLLSEVDFLFLDDLGKESRKADTKRNEWTHQILFKILDNRTNTIINTNLSSEEIKELYSDDFGNGALSSRIFEGATGKCFVYPSSMKDRRY